VGGGAWSALRGGRAIEHRCCVAGVNRVGVDGNQLHYAGDSAVIDVFGQPQLEIHGREQVVTTTMSAQVLAEHRVRFPAMLDADAFELKRPGVDR
ncbi:MAG TPA: nitrilase-related carbon-nitrogen hydrolase, partial [Xylella taiwanensis]